MLLYTTEHPYPTFLTIYLIQNLMLKCLNIFPLPDHYLMISENRYSWWDVPVLGIPLCSWVSAGGTIWEFATTWKLGQRIKNL